jgi:hypothetical protein
MVKKYDKFDFTPLRIEDAFSDDWWEGVVGQPPQKDLGVDVTNEGQSFLMWLASVPITHWSSL